VRLDINCLGQSHERMAHREALIQHLQAGRELLDAEAVRRLHSNPLRILDTKNPVLQGLVEAAPRLMDFLGEDSLKHFEGLCRVLDTAGQPYRINHRLVRGMDYYSLTVFEWITDRLGAQGTVCGGGRYDGLVELVGGKPAPGIGWGMGIERVLDLLDQSGVKPAEVRPHAFAVVPSADALPAAMQVVEVLRSCGVSVLMHAAGKDSWGSMKSQFKKADASGAGHALIFGAQELARGEVAVKPLRDSAAAQSCHKIADASQWAALLLNA
jgi:histidyl-tRNA synthetase